MNMEGATRIVRFVILESSGAPSLSKITLDNAEGTVYPRQKIM